MIGRAVSLVVVAVVAFAVLTAAVLARLPPLVHTDVVVHLATRRYALAHPAWTAAMRAITATGTTVVIGPPAAVGCLVLIRLRRWWSALLVGVGLPVTLWLRVLVMEVIARPRPSGWLTSAAGWSFPSGHTTAAATAALVAVVVLRPALRRRFGRVLLIAVAAGWAAAVGVSRVALGVHWPSDVLGGWLFAGAVAGAIALLLHQLTRRTGFDPEAPAGTVTDEQMS